ncbi:hypothetical protein NEOLEDRAFT_1133857 [Neolentinus lepideus HHB14362 ss-1]|uniref:Uncharacterized protein n=1 Tax=Neolentinus lepideus HHB14362 ss-1 TaxID=1314782 RepID=A0A165SGC8_9AGAM|nr:hypothetical protein NEOLEDRAFT_1133857 [Neolentinus lepideus HHB14362 ss-1]
MHYLHQSVNLSCLAFSPASVTSTISSFHVLVITFYNQVWITVKHVAIQVPKQF